MLKAFKEVGATLAEIVGAGDGMSQFVDDLVSVGVKEQARSLFDGLQEKYSEWTSGLKSKIHAQSQLLADEVKGFHLPTYDPDQHTSSSKEFGKTTGLMSKVATTINKLTGFQSAATVTAKLSGVDFDFADMSSCLVDAKTYLYIATVLAVLDCPTWKSVVPGMADKPDTKAGELVSSLKKAMKQAADDGIAFPGELQAKVADQLAKAGSSL